MIHAAWLILICPLCAAIGFFTCALCTIAKDADEQYFEEPWTALDLD